jgi:hypothetical protein
MLRPATVLQAKACRLSLKYKLLQSNGLNPRYLSKYGYARRFVVKYEIAIKMTSRGDAETRRILINTVTLNANQYKEENRGWQEEN